MAAHQTRADKLYEHFNSLGASNKGNRVSFRNSGRLLFHLPAVAFLGKFGHLDYTNRLSHRARSEYLGDLLIGTFDKAKSLS